MKISRRSSVVVAVVASALPALASSPASAATATYSVTSTADASAFKAASGCSTTSSPSGPCTLRSSIQAAIRGPGAAVIDLPAGTYKLTEGTALTIATGAVTISGAGPGATTIDADLRNRAFVVNGAATLRLDGVTVESGRTPALAGDASCPSGTDGPLPASQEGGAILDRGTVTLSDDVIEASLASGDGGAIADRSESGTLSIAGTTITGNATCPSIDAAAVTAIRHHRRHRHERRAHLLPREIPGVPVPSYGGGIFACGCSPMNISDSTISGNSTPSNAETGGGGVAVVGPGPDRIVDSTIAGNASAAGGGIAALPFGGPGGTLYLSGDTISGNTAESTAVPPLTRRAPRPLHRIPIGSAQAPGGGVMNAGFDVTVRNSTVTGNTASDGGGIASAVGSVTVSFSTVAANTATGAVPEGSDAAPTGNLQAVGGARFTLDDSIVAGGVSPSGAPTDCGASGHGSVISAGGNLFDDTSDGGGQCGAVASDVVNGAPGLAPLASNGGPTQTMALQPGSPAIDAANDDLCATETHGVDQRGVARPQGPHCDIGAFEYESADLSVSAPDGSPTVDVGQQTTVTDAITNNGPSTADGVTFTDPASGGFSIVSATSTAGACTHTATSVSCSIGSLRAGQSVTVTIVVSGTSAGVATLTSSVTSTTPDPTAADNQSTLSLAIDPALAGPAVATTPLGTPPTAPESADLAVTRSVAEPHVARGRRTTIILTVINHGPSADTGVTLVYRAPGSLRWVGADPSRGVRCTHAGVTLACAIGALRSGGSATVRVVVIPTRAGAIRDSARVTGAVSDPNLVNNVAVATVDVTAPPCAANLVFTSDWLPSANVGTARVYVDGRLTRTLHGADVRRVQIDPLPMAGLHSVTVAFIVGPFQTMTETRSYRGCTSGLTQYAYPPQTDPGAS